SGGGPGAGAGCGAGTCAIAPVLPSVTTRTRTADNRYDVRRIAATIAQRNAGPGRRPGPREYCNYDDSSRLLEVVAEPDVDGLDVVDVVGPVRTTEAAARREAVRESLTHERV